MNLGYKYWALIMVIITVLQGSQSVLSAQKDTLSERTPNPKKKSSKLQIQEANTLKTGNLPSSAAVLGDKAAHAFSKGDWSTARTAYREMLALDPENALVWANLGSVELRDGKPDTALTCFEASTRFNEKLVQSWIAQGNILSKRGDRYRALSYFSRAVHEDPLDPKAHLYLAVEAKNLGWRDTALQELQRSIDLKPDYGLAHFNIATVYLDQKPPAITLAKQHYEKALALGEAKDEILETKLKEE
jgi:tetratricopeptide (TPR) repeat protein